MAHQWITICNGPVSLEVAGVGVAQVGINHLMNVDTEEEILGVSVNNVPNFPSPPEVRCLVIPKMWRSVPCPIFLFPVAGIAPW